MNNPNNQFANGTKFLDLNFDVQLLVIEQLDLPDLLTLAESNNHLSILAETAFKSKLSKNGIEFWGFYSDFPEFQQIDNHIRIQNVDTMEKLLKSFGGSILKLIVNSNISKEKLELVNKINGLISTHCSDTLVQIDLTRFGSCPFDGFTKPFKKVENVDLHGTFTKMENLNYTFNQLFPAVKRLTMPSIKFSNESAIAWKLPQLEQLEFMVSPNSNDMKFFEDLLKKNPQLRSLKMGCKYEMFLPKVNELLPELENLELLYYFNDDINTHVDFKNVKILTMFRDRYNIGSPNVNFEKLTELHTNVRSHGYNWWTEFVNNSDTLERLHLDEGCADLGVFNEITSMELNLSEISLRPCNEVGENEVLEFVQNNENTKIFHFLSYNSLTSLAQILREKLAKEWTVYLLGNEIKVIKL